MRNKEQREHNPVLLEGQKQTCCENRDKKALMSVLITLDSQHTSSVPHHSFWWNIHHCVGYRRSLFRSKGLLLTSLLP